MKYSLFFLLLLMLFSCTNQQEKEETTANIFLWGIASGDPGQNNVVLWTKLAPEQKEKRHEVSIYLSEDSTEVFNNFKKKVWVDKEKDFTLKLLLEGLTPGTTYYYAFSTSNDQSAIGRTRTLPVYEQQIKLAIVSCSHFETGYFNVYKAISQINDLNAIVHLGDYIYEGAPAYPDGPRVHEPQHEIVSLHDYRTRYAQYRSDKDLQEVHRLHPMINIWDDHEIANNHWKGGSHVHDSTTEGTWSERQKNAHQAFFEWIPTMINIDEPLYRSFEFGSNLALHMLDTRYCCRTGIAENDEEAKNLEIVGQKQMNWLKSAIQSSEGTWNVLGNQVAFAPRDYYTWYPKWKNGAYDNWTGYPTEYAKMLELIREVDENILITTGDTHSAFFSYVINEKGDTLAREFITPSITSTTWVEGYADKGEAFAAFIQDNFKKHNPHIPWFDLKNHGFVLITADKSEAIAEWYMVSTILARNFEVSKVFSHKMRNNRD